MGFWGLITLNPKALNLKVVYKSPKPKCAQDLLDLDGGQDPEDKIETRVLICLKIPLLG